MSNIFTGIFGSIGNFLHSLTGGGSTPAAPVTDEAKKLISEFETALDGLTAAAEKVLPIGQALTAVYPPAAAIVAAVGIAVHSIEGAATAFEQLSGIPDADDAPATPPAAPPTAAPPATPQPTQ